MRVWVLTLSSAALPVQHPIILGQRQETTLTLIVLHAAETWIIIIRGIQFQKVRLRLLGLESCYCLSFGNVRLGARRNQVVLRPRHQAEMLPRIESKSTRSLVQLTLS